MEEDLKYMFTILAFVFVAFLAMLISRIITDGSISLLFGIVLGLFGAVLFVVHQIFKSDNSSAVENSKKRVNTISLTSSIVFSIFGIALARVFADDLSQNWANVLVGSITTFLIFTSGVLAYILWSYGKSRGVDDRTNKKRQEEFEWRERLRLQKDEDAKWRKNQRRK